MVMGRSPGQPYKDRMGQPSSSDRVMLECEAPLGARPALGCLREPELNRASVWSDGVWAHRLDPVTLQAGQPLLL